MAAPLMYGFVRNSVKASQFLGCRCSFRNQTVVRSIAFSSHRFRSRSKDVIVAAGVCATLAGTYTYFTLYTNRNQLTAPSQFFYTELKAPAHPNVARKVSHAGGITGLQLTLYQYQTCPFCCKVRAFLDYNGFSYDVVEVNSVTRADIKWSPYKKVPILQITDKNVKESYCLVDSTNIISILESLLKNNGNSVPSLLSAYPILKDSSEGKDVYMFPNRYHIMDVKNINLTKEDPTVKKERKWRKWVDNDFVHVLSPNIYRSPTESLQAFRYFSEVGDWRNTFSTFERLCVVYVGALAMYFVGKRLKRKYSLSDDVRQSLYNSTNTWLKAVGKQQPFLGGQAPNLADLEVYGALNAIEGCDAFRDLLEHTEVKGWYYRTKAVVSQSRGATT